MGSLVTEHKVRYSNRHSCPRRKETSNQALRSDTWVVMDDPAHPGAINNGMPACSFCGSLNPEFLLEKIKELWTVGPTDKNYKIYLTGPAGESGKFYFMHLSEEQIIEFTDLYNTRRMLVGHPGVFYSKPYFWV